MKLATACFILFLSSSLLFSQKNTKEAKEDTKNDIVKNNSFKDPNIQKPKKNEISFNALSLLTGIALDFSFEKVFNTKHSLGTTLRFGFREIEDTDRKMLQNSSISLYYRCYFLKHTSFKSKGIFIEVFSSYVNLDIREDITPFDWGIDYTDLYGTTSAQSKTTTSSSSQEQIFSRAETITSFAIGIGLGKKWIIKNNFTFEIFAGFGLYNADEINHNNLLGRLGISIGKRF